MNHRHHLPLAALLLVPLLAGCANLGKPVTPSATLDQQVGIAENSFTGAALAVDLFADIYQLQPSTRARIHAAVDEARTLVAGLVADYHNGTLDAPTVVRRIVDTVRQLEQNRTAVVASEPKARELRAP